LETGILVVVKWEKQLTPDNTNPLTQPKSLADELAARIPQLKNRLETDERKVAGGLRTVNADVSESHELDGLRLAVELKPINLAVGRAIWNRFGDIRTFAVNIHLKFRLRL
jgi:hypothetical protein